MYCILKPAARFLIVFIYFILYISVVNGLATIKGFCQTGHSSPPLSFPTGGLNYLTVTSTLPDRTPNLRPLSNVLSPQCG